MEDKNLENNNHNPVIKNGVNVCECKHLDLDNGEFNNEMEYESGICTAFPIYINWKYPEYRLCSQYNNCYYKQLQRKTEECELMEIAIKIKDQRNEDYSKTLSDKSKKCEELKEENKDLKDLNNRLDNMRETYYKEYLKLDNKLNEIYKIADTLIILTNEYDNCYHKDRCNKCKDREECQYYQAEKILNIIKKVKENK